MTNTINRNRRIVSVVNVLRPVTPDTCPRVWACWSIAQHANGVAYWAFTATLEGRHPVRNPNFRDRVEGQFEEFWAEVVEGIRDHRGSRPPRSVASALKEQVRKRVWNERRRAARRAEAAAAAAAAAEPTLFG